jgi:hypothetical protein
MLSWSMQRPFNWAFPFILNLTRFPNWAQMAPCGAKSSPLLIYPVAKIVLLPRQSA